MKKDDQKSAATFHVNPKAAQAAEQAAPVWVMFDTPGVPRIGPYERDTPYQVDAVEAERLINVKGFQRTTAPVATNNEES